MHQPSIHPVLASIGIRIPILPFARFPHPSFLPSFTHNHYHNLIPPPSASPPDPHDMVSPPTQKRLRHPARDSMFGYSARVFGTNNSIVQDLGGMIFWHLWGDGRSSYMSLFSFFLSFFPSLFVSLFHRSETGGGVIIHGME